VDSTEPDRIIRVTVYSTQKPGSCDEFGGRCADSRHKPARQCSESDGV